VRYFGICCGNSGNFTRAMAESLGRAPPASKYVTGFSVSVGAQLRGNLKCERGRIL